MPEFSPRGNGILVKKTTRERRALGAAALLRELELKMHSKMHFECIFENAFKNCIFKNVF